MCARRPVAERGGGTRREGKRAVERDYNLQATGYRLGISRTREVRGKEIYCIMTAMEVRVTRVAGELSGQGCRAQIN